MFNVDSRATQVSAYEYYQWRRDKELEHYILKQQESRFLRKRLQRGATALAGARILEALGKEIDKDELNALNRAGMRFYLGAQQGLLEKVGKAIFNEIAAEEVNWIAGKKQSDWGGGFALWTRDKEEAKLSEKAKKKAKWAYYRALESDWESNGLFEKSGAGETGRLTRQLLRYQMIHGFGNSQFGLSPKERALWQAGEHDLIQPLTLGFIEQIAHSIIIAVGTMGIGTALSAVDAISKFGATALTTLAGTGMQVGASFVSSGSNLWGGADPYLEGQKLASALSKSVIAGGLGVLSAGAGEILGEGLVGKVLVDGGLAAGRSMIGGALSSAVLGEALDGKGLLLNAAFAGLGGGIASGLGQMEGLGSLGEDMLNSGVHFGLDTGKAALMALDGDGNFDDTQFLADWGGSFAGNGFSALGSLASYGISASMDSYNRENAPQQSNNWENIGKIGSIMELGGYVAESAVRGAIIKQSQTLDGNIIGQLLGNTFLGIDAISREAQARGGNFGDFVDQSIDRVREKSLARQEKRRQKREKKKFLRAINRSINKRELSEFSGVLNKKKGTYQKDPLQTETEVQTSSEEDWHLKIPGSPEQQIAKYFQGLKNLLDEALGRTGLKRNDIKPRVQRKSTQEQTLERATQVRPAEGYSGPRSGYGYRENPLRPGEQQFHPALDIANQPGTPIVATGPGVVVRVGESPIYGKSISIDHGNNVTTHYSHNQKNMVEKGDRVETGQQIAEMGATGAVTGPHVDYMIRTDGKPNPYNASTRPPFVTLDPEKYLPYD